MPRVGMRIFKTFVSVFLCLCLNLLMWDDGIPFYSAIAAILCMQTDASNSMKAAVNRTVGTFIGGIFGMIVLVLLRDVIPQDLYGYRFWEYLIVSLCVIPLIRATVIVQKPAAAYITCVVFLSITISHGTDANPYFFALNRILDTLLGIFVSLGVNWLHLPRRRNRKLLMLAALEDTVLHDQGVMGYTRFKLNEMLRHGALITVLTKEAPAVFASRQDGVEWVLPVIAMRGAVLYDVKKGQYISYSFLEEAAVDRITGMLAAQGTECFIFCVIHHNLHIYYKNLDHPAMLAHYEAMNRLPGQHYICGFPPPGVPVLAIKAFGGDGAADAMRADLAELEAAGEIRVFESDAGEAVCVEIYSGVPLAEQRTGELQALYAAEAVAFFGSREEDLSWAECAAAVYAVGQAEEGFRRRADAVLENPGGNAAARTMGKLFHARQPLSDKKKAAGQ